ncbi:MAG: molybdenum cofactor biosynthesis protein MoaE [Candidatus Limnocylindrus sp.]
MQVRVRLFAMIRSREGASEVALNLHEGATLNDLVDAFFTTRPALSALRPHVRIGVSGTLVARGADLRQIRVAPDTEYALLPPASGGAEPRLVTRIVPAPLRDEDISALVREVATDADGAVVIFVGRTRVTPGTPAPGEEDAAAPFANSVVTQLEYEAADGYAESELADICERLFDDGLARQGGIGVLHAVGVVPVGAISMITVVASPHRERAYIVSRALIESIKQDVPIWKSEHFDGGAVWGANPTALTKSS